MFDLAYCWLYEHRPPISSDNRHYTVWCVQSMCMCTCTHRHTHSTQIIKTCKNNEEIKFSDFHHSLVNTCDA